MADIKLIRKKKMETEKWKPVCYGFHFKDEEKVTLIFAHNLLDALKIWSVIPRTSGQGSYDPAEPIVMAPFWYRGRIYEVINR